MPEPKARAPRERKLIPIELPLLTNSQYVLFYAAASAEGKSVANFILAAALREAARVMELKGSK